MTVASSTYSPFSGPGAWKEIVVGTAWSDHVELLRHERESASPAELKEALDYTLRSAAIETGAIEGLYQTDRGITRAVALQVATWEADLAKIGPDVKHHFDDQLAAFELVLDVATRCHPVTESWIRELHAVLTRHQGSYRVLTDLGWQDRSLVGGHYKTEANSVTQQDGVVHHYASVLDTAPEMERLVSTLSLAEFQDTHPILQAAYAHYALTSIHPFPDGNGRTARALASMYLYRSAGIPLLTFADQSLQYFDALAGADRGAYEPFARFIESRALDTIGILVGRLRLAKRPLSQASREMSETLKSHAGLTHGEVQMASRRLGELIGNELKAGIEEASLPPDITMGGFSGSVGQCSFWNQPYHVPLGATIVGAHVQSNQPVSVTSTLQLVVGIANSLSNAETFIVVDIQRQVIEPLKLRLDQVHPTMGRAATIRVADWVRATMANWLAEYNDQLASTIRKAGY